MIEITTIEIITQSYFYKLMPLKPCVFLDRDGVLNQEAGYIHKLEDLVLIDGVADAVRSLNERNLFCCLVSNQAGAARGYYDLAHIEALHMRLQNLLKIQAGAYLNAVYYCPSLSKPEGGVNPSLNYYSTWRKPNTGMLVAASWQHDLDLRRSFMVGDKATDIDLAHNAGCKGILVKSGFGKEVLSGNYQHLVQPDYTCDRLPDAVEWILNTQEN